MWSAPSKVIFVLNMIGLYQRDSDTWALSHGKRLAGHAHRARRGSLVGIPYHLVTPRATV